MSRSTATWVESDAAAVPGSGCASQGASASSPNCSRYAALPAYSGIVGSQSDALMWGGLRRASGPATVQRHEVAPRRTGVELARTADLVRGIGQHLVPLRDPAGGARHREQRGEHAGGDAHRAEDDAGIEVDVGVELALDEVVVLQRDAFELERDLELRIVAQVELVEHLVAGVADDRRARVHV